MPSKSLELVLLSCMLHTGQPYLVPDHLVVSLLLRNGAEILMGPCVTCNLMSFGDHTLNGSSPWLARIVDRAFVNVDTGNEESGLCLGGFELIQHAFSVNVRSIIVSDGDCVWLSAVVDTLSTVGLATELRTSNVAGAASSWDFVGVATWTILKLAVGCLAVVTYS